MSPPTWWLRFASRPAAAARLICFSYAGGGGAVYRPFALALPPSIEVVALQLPGRENRLREAPLTSLPGIVEAVVPQLTTLLDRPFAFFGHSMGSLVAYEVARALAARGAPGPAHLMVSARRAPHLGEADPPLHALPDEDFIAAIDRRYGGIPAEILQHRDLLELLLPALRADMRAIETHRHVPGPLLDCPITVFGGSADTRAQREVLAPWREHTRGSTQLQQFAGGHFYFNDVAVRGQLVGEVARLLAPLAAGREARPCGAPAQ